MLIDFIFKRGIKCKIAEKKIKKRLKSTELPKGEGNQGLLKSCDKNS